jgi:outer membrane protein OmpA-like peptidoglycan-associated protein
MISYKTAFVFIVALCCRSFTAFAQIDTLHLYYNINQKVVSTHRLKIDSAFVADKSRIEAMRIIGYADYLGSKPYNTKLSLTRANNVKAYLRELFPGIDIVSTGKGEQPFYGYLGAKGSPKDRRVDVIVLKIIPTLPMPQDTLTVISESSPGTKEPRVIKDTLFRAKLDRLTTLNPGERIDIDELLFIGGRHFLTPASYKYADILVELMKKHPTLKIKIIGHICCEYNERDGFDFDNKKYALSKYRAEFVFDYLVKAGIDRDRMSHKGVGSSDPKVFPEVTAHDSEMNRRVEIVVVSNKE